MPSDISWITPPHHRLLVGEVVAELGGDERVTAVLPSGDGIEARRLVQRRLDGGRGRVVERLTLRSGRRVVVKARNDRAPDREALVYRHLLSRAGDLVPASVGSATIRDVHVLALDWVDGRPCNPSAPADRGRAMAALARFHQCFPGSSVAAILGPTAPPELAAEATPDPIEEPGLLGNYRDALTSLAAVLEHWPDPDDLLRRYLVNSAESPTPVVAAVHAGQVWLALRDEATRVAGGTAVSPELVRRLLLRLGR
jgi:hypothetical protein